MGTVLAVVLGRKRWRDGGNQWRVVEDGITVWDSEMLAWARRAVRENGWGWFGLTQPSSRGSQGWAEFLHAFSMMRGGTRSQVWAQFSQLYGGEKDGGMGVINGG